MTDPAQGHSGFIGWILDLMDSLGELGVGVAILLETFIPPIPSEAVLPGAGFLAYEGRMNVWLAWAAATVGSVLGAWIWYAIGAALGRDRTRRLVGRLPLLDHDDFDKAEAFFVRWGGLAVLLGRCVPLVRSFVSIPAGVERMSIWRFTTYTTVGSGVWNALWIGIGFAFGPAISPALERWSGVLSNVVIVLLVLLVGWFVVKRVRRRSSGSSRLAEHTDGAR
ncbi:DedA family protein [Gordonia sp. zg691]|uniref:DedA family protein n=1 Tax=Gordonia jinghuaiqii TaxID=2758710 RepID=A0A7D7RB10_9ACTN|nr:DedA family protein [Gordonia jinghuaiqii]MBD0862962.1 DedA family protein [Gordonia jinghuaiqii]QMT01750.1 DedA family protein [Gordonia jinghuaiqii]